MIPTGYYGDNDMPNKFEQEEQRQRQQQQQQQQHEQQKHRHRPPNQNIFDYGALYGHPHQAAAVANVYVSAAPSPPTLTSDTLQQIQPMQQQHPFFEYSPPQPLLYSSNPPQPPPRPDLEDDLKYRDLQLGGKLENLVGGAFLFSNFFFFFLLKQ